MAVDMLLPYGGPITFAANGDVAMVTDVPGDPAATRQRIVFALLTSPRLLDGQGNPISKADDPFHPDYGAGLPAAIGQNVTPALIAGITARVTQALALDPNVAASPTPTVTVTQPSLGTIVVDVTASAITGETIVVPSIDLSALVAAG
jgi:phage baseplate assembly protein W